MKLYTRRDMARLASIGVAGIATGGLAVEFPSSVSSRARGLLALKVQNWRASGNGEEEMYKELYNALVARSMTGDIHVDATTVGTYGLAYNPNVTSVSAPNITSIGTYAFYSDTNLQTITCPDDITINPFCFYGCTHLTGIGTSNRVKGSMAGNSAFQNCSSLRSLEINLTGGSLGANIFAGCTSLVSLKFTGVKVVLSNGPTSWNGIGTGSSTVTFASNTMAEIRAIANIMNGLKAGTTVVCNDGSFSI